jgi:hypothetical protein
MKLHQSSQDSFEIEGEEQFYINGQAVCILVKKVYFPIQKESLIKRIIKWLRRS